MQAGGRSSTDAPERFALRRGLVVVQVALSLVLIVGALLFARSLRNLVTLDPGSGRTASWRSNVDLRRAASNRRRRRQISRRSWSSVRAVPGVDRARPRPSSCR